MNKHFLNKRLVHQLGFAGLIPFVFLLLGCWFADRVWIQDFLNGQFAYSVAVLSFVGGIHWGATMLSPDLSAQQTRQALLLATVPAILAFVSTMLAEFRFAALMVGYVVAYQIDKRLFVWYRAPEWLTRLRFVLTCCVVPIQLLTVFSLGRVAS